MVNIFFLHEEPIKGVRWYYDQHVNKIATEITQIGYTAVFLNLKKNRQEYRRFLESHCAPLTLAGKRGYVPSHIHHPMSKWMAYSYENFEYGLLWGFCLANEYSFRYEQRIHASFEHLQWLDKLVPPSIFPNQGFTLPPLCMPLYLRKKPVKCMQDVISAHRKLYRSQEKIRLCRYKRREIPYWIVKKYAQYLDESTTCKPKPSRIVKLRPVKTTKKLVTNLK